MTAAARTHRFAALDVFRGITIFLMILVNTAGPGAPAWRELVHARWVGFTLADAVFPSFLFAMGAAMSFAGRRQLAHGPYLASLLRRSAIIFLLGFLMYWFPFVDRTESGWVWRPFADTRVPGVLQRIALCQLTAGLLVRWLSPRAIFAACVVLLLGYWAILIQFSAPGLAFDKVGNAGTRLDLWLLGQQHLYRKDGGFDPEGLLGTMPATVNVLAGYLVGRALQGASQLPRRLTVIALVGVAAIGLGLMWSPSFPVMKKLWTGSFVLVTVGIDCLLLAALVWFTDIVRRQEGVRFFTILGVNPLAIYLFSELFVVVLQMVRVDDGTGLYDWVGAAVFQVLVPGPAGSFLYHGLLGSGPVDGSARPDSTGVNLQCPATSPDTARCGATRPAARAKPSSMT